MPATRRQVNARAGAGGKVAEQKSKRKEEADIASKDEAPAEKRARKQTNKTTSKTQNRIKSEDANQSDVAKSETSINDKKKSKPTVKSKEETVEKSKCSQDLTKNKKNVRSSQEGEKYSNEEKLSDTRVKNKEMKPETKVAKPKQSQELSKTDKKAITSLNGLHDQDGTFPSNDEKHDQMEKQTKKKPEQVSIIKEENCDAVEIMSDSSDSDFEEVPEPKVSIKNKKKSETDVKQSKTLKSQGTPSASKAEVLKDQKLSQENVKKETAKPPTPKKHGSPKKEKMSLDGVSPMDLLLRLESDPGKNPVTKAKRDVKPGHTPLKTNPEEMSDSDNESDWENVVDVNLEKELKDQVPDKPVEITLQEPSLFQKRRKRKQFDLEDWFQKQVNKYQREQHLEMHKVHLLCLLSVGFQRNGLCNDLTLQAIALSNVPLQVFSQPVKKWDTSFLTKLTKWFSKFYNIDAETDAKSTDLVKTMMSRLDTKKVASEEELVYLFLLTVRSLGGEVRLVISFQPVSHKPNLKNFLIKRRRREQEEDSQEGDASVSPSSNTDSQAAGVAPSSTKSSEENKEMEEKETSTGKKKEKENSSGKKEKPASSKKKNVLSKDTKEAGCASQKDSKKATISKGKSPKSGKNVIVKKSQKKSSQNEADAEAEKEEAKRASRRSSAGKKSYKEEGSDVEDSDEDNFKPNLSESSSEDERDTSPKRVKGKCNSRSKPSPSSEDVLEISSGSDFEEMNTTFRSPPPRKRKPKNKKILSSDSDDSIEVIKEKIKTKGTDYWAEVYVEKEKKWLCVDCLRVEINKPHELESRATKPISYIMAFDNGDYVKDVTRRYASSFSNTRKNRPDPEWWEETVETYAAPEAEKDSNEDLQLQAELMQKPLPTSVGEYKNHPLYALKRHLLKFEAFYPESAVPVGYIRGEAVYSRECVQVLHTRENWLKEARVVRIGETPYKLVKGRRKRRQALAGGDIEPVAELFGRWQTEDYIPPPAVDGKVPKNEYGNIELFKPSMLPGGTVHLKGLNGLNRVARKLNIDVAAAMVGWDHHCGFAHPVLDGWVVCEEHKDILLAAWDEEQEIIKEREAQKREKRIYANWKLLIKGILIKEKLKSRFNLEPKDDTTQDSATPGSSGQKASDVEMSWPLNRQKEKPKSKSKQTKKEEGPLFPFEEI